MQLPHRTATALLVALAVPGAPARSQQPTPAEVDAAIAALGALAAEQRAAAAEVLGRTGPAVLVPLAERLADPSLDPRTRRAIWSALEPLGDDPARLGAFRTRFGDALLAVLDGRVPEDVRRAATLIARLDLDGARAVTARIRDLSMPAQELLNALLAAIRRGADPATEALVEATLAAPPQLRGTLLARIEQLGDDARTAGAARGWVAVLGDGPPELRAAAVAALERLGPAAAEQTGALIALLPRLGDPALQARLAFALGSIGPAAVPALEGALADADAPQRELLVEALGFVGEAGLAALVERLGDPAPAVRYRALRALQRCGDVAVPALERALADPARARAAREVLRRLGR